MQGDIDASDVAVGENAADGIALVSKTFNCKTVSNTAAVEGSCE